MTELGDQPHQQIPHCIAMFNVLVQTTDGYSNKSMLTAPTPADVARLAQWSRSLQPEAITEGKPAAPHRSLRRRLAPRAIEELVARYTAGEETPALSGEFSISASGLRDLLRAEGVSLRGHKITEADVDVAVRLYERGLSITGGCADRLLARHDPKIAYRARCGTQIRRHREIDGVGRVKSTGPTLSGM